VRVASGMLNGKVLVSEVLAAIENKQFVVGKLFQHLPVYDYLLRQHSTMPLLETGDTQAVIGGATRSYVCGGGGGTGVEEGVNGNCVGGNVDGGNVEGGNGDGGASVQLATDSHAAGSTCRRIRPLGNKAPKKQKRSGQSKETLNESNFASVAAALQRTADEMEATHASSTAHQVSAAAAVDELRRKNDIALSMCQLEAFKTLFGHSSNAPTEQQESAEVAMRSILLHSLRGVNKEQLAPSSSAPSASSPHATVPARPHAAASKRVYKALFPDAKDDVGDELPIISSSERNFVTKVDGVMEDEGIEAVDIEKTQFGESDTKELVGNPSSHIAEILKKTTTLTPQARQTSLLNRACSIAGYTIFNNDTKESSPEALPTTQSTILPPLKFIRACAVGDDFCKFDGHSLCPQSFCKNKSCSSRTINVIIYDACA
jgi:hypothetical protein